jgi:sucrose phosphorylase
MALLERTGTGRDINRHHYDAAEVDEACARPVVQELFSLIRLRNTHPAFQGAFEVLATSASTIGLRWQNGPHFAELAVDFPARRHSLRHSGTA